MKPIHVKFSTESKTVVPVKAAFLPVRWKLIGGKILEFRFYPSKPGTLSKFNQRLLT